MRMVFGIKSTLLKRRPALSYWTNLHSTQLSHLWRPVLWQSSLSFTAPQSPNRTLQAARSVVTDMAFFRRLGPFDKATVGAEWRHEGLECRHSACLQCMATAGTWPGRLIGTAVFVPWHRHQIGMIYWPGDIPPPQQQVVLFPLSQPIIVGCFSRPVLIPLTELQIIQSGHIGPNFEEFQISWFLLGLKSELV